MVNIDHAILATPTLTDCTKSTKPHPIEEAPVIHVHKVNSSTLSIFQNHITTFTGLLDFQIDDCKKFNLGGTKAVCLKFGYS